MPQLWAQAAYKTSIFVMKCVFTYMEGMCVMLVHTPTTPTYLHSLSLLSLIQNDCMLRQEVLGTTDSGWCKRKAFATQQKVLLGASESFKKNVSGCGILQMEK